MNPLIREAAQSVQMGWLLGLMTIVFFIAFLGWTWWAYAPSRRRLMEEYGRIPFDDPTDEIWSARTVQTHGRTHGEAES